MEDIIKRINELARKLEESGLSEEELAERSELRKKYMEVFRGNLKNQLDSIKYVEDQEQDPEAKE